MWRRSGKGRRGEDELAAARQTAWMLAQGHRLCPIDTPLRTLPGEQCYVRAPVRLLQFGVDPDPGSARLSGWGVGWSGLLVVSGATRSRPQPAGWRLVDSGTLYLTDRRFAVDGSHHWTDLWFSSVRVADVDGDAIQLRVADAAPTRLQVPSAAEYFVVFSWLAYRELPRFADLAAMGRGAG